MFRCDEPGCEEKFDDRNEFTVHTSYHDYLQKIKEHGRQELELLEKRFNTEIKCHLVDRMEEGCYYFPQLPSRLICGWHQCNAEFLSAETFYEHVSNHAHRVVDKCYWENCNKSMKKITTQLLREHLRVHTLQKLYACSYCGNLFSTKIKFDDHYLRHLPPPDFLQNKELNPIVIAKKDGDITFNIEEYHIDGNKIKIFRCSYENCDKALLTSSLLREHIRNHSNKNKCDKCPFVAISSSNLKSHKLYRHQNDRNQSCTICLKTFKARADLRAHIRRHQIVEPFRCDKCEFEALNEDGLNTHMKIHEKNHDYCCHICNRVFSRGNNLSRHLKDQHKLAPANGHSKFRYKLIDAGVYVLDTGNNGDTLERQPDSVE